MTAPPDERLAGRIEAALARALDWLGGLSAPPGLQARGEDGRRVDCPTVPYAVALATGMARRGSALRPPDTERLEGWLRAVTDPDGQVRFFGPGHALIGPDHDDLALVWLERRALLGERPPTELLTRLLQRRLPGGAFDTWPSPPEDGPEREADAAVNANVLAWLGALGRRNPAAEAWLTAQLQRGDAALVAPYYPDPAVVWLLAWRALEHGGLSALPALPLDSAATGEHLMGRAVAASAGSASAVEALLQAQTPEGFWPWAPVFVGGPRTGLPGGEVLPRPWFGGEALSTALIFEALARFAGLPLPPLAPDQGRVHLGSDSAAAAATWESLVGELGAQIRLVADERASRVFPVLQSPAGRLELDIEPVGSGPSYRRAGAWAVSYRGPRTPDAAETRALERLVRELDALAPQGPESDAPEPPEQAAAPTLDVTAPDASDLAGRLDALPAGPSEVVIRLPATLRLPDATPAIDRALRTCRARGLRPSLRGLPVCALALDEAWVDEAWVGGARPADARPLAPACGRCVAAPRCAGPAGGALRPRTSETPWQPLRRAGLAWAERFGEAAAGPLPAWATTLETLAAGPALRGVDWSLTLALDVVANQLSPALRLAAFHGRAAGSVVGGEAVLAALPELARVAGCLSDVAALQAALAGPARTLPIYPGLEHGPDGARVSAYLDTDHLPAEAAWAAAADLAAPLGLTCPAPTPAPPLLGLSLHLGTDGRATLDLYARWRGEGSAPWLPPAEVAALTTVDDLVLTLRGRPGEALSPRKWDLPWWPRGEDDEALASALGLPPGAADGGRAHLLGLLGDERFTLQPTTFGWREGGRRIYARLL